MCQITNMLMRWLKACTNLVLLQEAEVCSLIQEAAGLADLNVRVQRSDARVHCLHSAEERRNGVIYCGNYYTVSPSNRIARNSRKQEMKPCAYLVKYRTIILYVQYN